MHEVKKGKILAAAQKLYLRYGYKRVNMNDIAAAAGISRPALYLLFKNKEEIFGSVYLQWVDATLAEMALEVAKAPTPKEKLECAFEIWAVRPFDLMMTSPEAKELLECSFEFAQPSFRHGYEKFEATIVPLVIALAAKVHMSPEGTAHVLASAVRGFKQTATTSAELRKLIKDLLLLCRA